LETSHEVENMMRGHFTLELIVASELFVQQAQAAVVLNAQNGIPIGAPV
jgi:hypothetical protein